MAQFKSILAAIMAGLVMMTNAQEDGYCTCSGVDYVDGGTYFLDGMSDNFFGFTSAFWGQCILIDESHAVD